MQFEIPLLQNTAAWRQRVTLDGSDFLLDFAWNEREGAWYLTIYTADEDLLLASRKIVTARPLLKRFRFVAGLPAGEFFATDFTGEISYAGYSELGTAVRFFYLDAAEIAP